MNYELMIAAVNDKADQLLGRIEKSLKDANGANVEVDRLGKKQLAYAIKKQTDATYFVLNFDAEGEAIKPVWDKLRLEQEDLLRYILIKKENKKLRKSKKKVSEVAEVSKVSKEEEKEKPMVTVAVKKSIKSTRSTRSASGARRARSTRSIKGTKAKKATNEKKNKK